MEDIHWLAAQLGNLCPFCKVGLWALALCLVNPLLAWGLAALSYRTRSFKYFFVVILLTYVATLVIESLLLWGLLQLPVPVKVICCAFSVAIAAVTLLIAHWIVFQGGWRGVGAG